METQKTATRQEWVVLLRNKRFVSAIPPQLSSRLTTLLTSDKDVLKPK